MSTSIVGAEFIAYIGLDWANAELMHMMRKSQFAFEGIAARSFADQFYALEV